jgi:uncharacterized membrane protein
MSAKPQEPRESVERRLARPLSRLLLVGLLLAILLMLVGAVLAVAGPDDPVARESSIVDLPRGLADAEPGAFFNLGLLILLATPVVRIIALVATFSRRRAWVFTCVSVVVLAVLALSVFLGLRAG